MPQKKRRKSRTILFQIALIFLAVMLVLLVSFSAAIYTSTVNSFLEAQEESMEVVLNRMQDLLHKAPCMMQANRGASRRLETSSMISPRMSPASTCSIRNSRP